MSEATEALTLQFLAWVGERPRNYADAMEAWRTSCPRLSIWEDALREDLVAVERGESCGMRQAAVVLTARGRRRLLGAAPSRPTLARAAAPVG